MRLFCDYRISVIWMLGLFLIASPAFSAVDVTGKTRWAIPELNIAITLPDMGMHMTPPLAIEYDL